LLVTSDPDNRSTYHVLIGLLYYTVYDRQTDRQTVMSVIRCHTMLDTINHHVLLHTAGS